jgi:hypothetical protein
MDKQSIFKPKYWLSQSKKILSSAFERFPLSLAFFLAFATLLIIEINLPYERVRELRELYNRLYGSFALGSILSMATKVLIERLKKGKVEELIANLAVLALTFIFFQFLLPEYNTITAIRLGFSIAALLLAFIFIPYFLKRENFEIYVAELITIVATTIFFSVILGLGVTALIFAIKSLLIESLSNDFYAYTWIITGFAFAPSYFFYALPKHDKKLTRENFANVIKAALIYLVLPLLSAYTVVLYLYFARIILTWHWPSGIVSYLVVSYTAIGIVSIFLAWPFRDNKWVDMFIKVYTKAIFPLLAMMFIAIYLRINQYGITENRYFIVLIGLWATFAMIFLNIDKGKKNIILVVSLALALILASYGPLSATSMTIRSQNNRFEDLLIENSMLDGSRLVPSSSIDNKSRQDIASIIDHFFYNYGFEKLDYLPNDFSFDRFEATLGFSRYDISQPDRQYFSFYTNFESLVIGDYDLLIPIDYYRSGTNYNTKPIVYQGDFYNIRYNDFAMSVYKNEEELVTMYLDDQAKLLGEGSKEVREPVNQEDLIFMAENDSVMIKAVYTHLHGSYAEDLSTIRDVSINGYLLIQIK